MNAAISANELVEILGALTAGALIGCAGYVVVRALVVAGKLLGILEEPPVEPAAPLSHVRPILGVPTELETRLHLSAYNHLRDEIPAAAEGEVSA